ncbi:unnamed protein product [Strongylus vulgaris]|uniref:Tyrosine specific protein phosphatases domain-containing protein n=1 Tax=Strongylus vulgaris TaxID=40348 RepID=A0A3P7LMH3_STRVU|nr:unnamed protein product [Strongylus vulgaris]
MSYALYIICVYWANSAAEDWYGDGFSVRQISVNKLKLKFYCINGWSDEKAPPKDFTAVHEKIRNAIDINSKGTLMLLCKDGCSRSGIYALIDMETERYSKKGRIKLGETIKALRSQRSNCFDTKELFEAAAQIMTESGIYALIDMETERYSRKGRIKLGETIKALRSQRSNCFDTKELFEAAAQIMTEFARKALEKPEPSKGSIESK